MYNGPRKTHTRRDRVVVTIVTPLAFFGLVLALWACGGEQAAAPTPPPPPRTGLHFTVSAAVADTVQAIIATPVTAELRDGAGSPIAGTPLLFSVSDSSAQLFAVQPTSASFGTVSITATTDASGRASVWIRLGHVAGPFTIRVLEGVRSLTDSMTATVSPGHPFALRVDPQDTAVWVGHSFDVQAWLLDRFNNATPTTNVTTKSETNVATSSGDTITGSVIGRTGVRVSAGGVGATTLVSVVPNGVLAFYAVDFFGKNPLGVYVMNTDGSGGHWAYKVDAPGTGLANEIIGLWPSSSPDGSQIAFVQLGTLWQVPTAGGPPIKLSAAATDDFSPEYSADGQWIYFTQGSSQFACWRIHPDGTGLSQVTTAPNGSDQAPSPNPAGSVIAYQTIVPPNDQYKYQIALDSIASGVTTNLNVIGFTPKWSPQGDRIAYLNPDHLALISPSGAALGPLGPALDATGGFSWSPAGDWIVLGGSAYGGGTPLDLVQVSTGLAIPLSFTGPNGQVLYNPTWLHGQ